MPSANKILPADEILNAGDIFTFGKYEQDNDMKNGAEPIEWQVLAVENGQALVISRYALDAKPYNETYRYVTWRDSTLRAWLNAVFYNNAFNSAEKKGIEEVKNYNPLNPSSGARGGPATKDKIFLLSIDEANRYFSDDNARQCEATAFAKENGAYIDGNGDSWWWLRSPGSNGHNAAIVLWVGYISHPGHGIVNPYNSVRPAFWLDLSDLSSSDFQPASESAEFPN